MPSEGGAQTVEEIKQSNITHKPNEEKEEDEEESGPPPHEPIRVPTYGSVAWIYYWGTQDGHYPSPCDVSITRSLVYLCPELRWYNYDVYPHKIKMTNTGYTVVISAKWKAERPYLEGGPFLRKYIVSQIHFHWGANLMEGSDHSVDKRKHPGEMQVTYFMSEYLTQEEALRHHDGVVIICYLIKHGVNPDVRLERIIERFPKIRVAQTRTAVGPYPMSELMPMFFEDYFLYWGTLDTARGESYVVRWIVPRITLFATMDMMKEFRKLWDPWDEPNLQNFRPLQETGDRIVFFINPHWNKYNSLLPIPRVPEESISVLSPVYENNMHLLPHQNAYMLPPPPTLTAEEAEEEEIRLLKEKMSRLGKS